MNYAGVRDRPSGHPPLHTIGLNSILCRSHQQLIWAIQADRMNSYQSLGPTYYKFIED